MKKDGHPTFKRLSSLPESDLNLLFAKCTNPYMSLRPKTLFRLNPKAVLFSGDHVSAENLGQHVTDQTLVPSAGTFSKVSVEKAETLEQFPPLSEAGTLGRSPSV